MTDVNDRSLFEAILDSWDRNNAILVNLLRALPDGGLEASVTEDRPTVAQQLSHIHLVRLALVAEDAPEAARDVPGEEWAAERDPDRLASRLTESAEAVRKAVKGRIDAGRGMDIHYDHPLLLLQHLIWHEGYHHGQIKLALEAAGLPLTDDEAGPLTWDLWMLRT